MDINELTASMMEALVVYLKGGTWLKVPLRKRINFSGSTLQVLFQEIDMSKVTALAREHVEERVAAAIAHGLQQEISYSVKHLLKNKDVREALRAVIGPELRRLVLLAELKPEALERSKLQRLKDLIRPQVVVQGLTPQQEIRYGYDSWLSSDGTEEQ